MKRKSEVESSVDDSPDGNDSNEELEDAFEDGDEGDEAPGGFELGLAVNTANTQVRTISQFIQMFDTPYLDLSPTYQRDFVWNEKKMTKLVDSLILNYYVPPIIFNVQIVDMDGHTRYKRTAVDGKQRLSSIRAFTLGKIACTDKYGRKWYYIDNKDGRKKNILPASQKRLFDSKELVCVEYVNLERVQEEELFSRVQLGVALTNAEKLKAISGPWQDFATEVEEHYQDLVKLSDSKRGRSFERILQIFSLLVDADNQASSIPSWSAASPLRIPKFCTSSTPDEAFKARVRRVFNTYNELAVRHPDIFQNNNYSIVKTFSPVEFLCMSVLIDVYHERSIIELRGDILALRIYARKELRDLRTNIATWKLLMKWVEKLEIYQGPASATTARHDHSPRIPEFTKQVHGRDASAFEEEEEDEDADGDSILIPASKSFRAPTPPVEPRVSPVHVPRAAKPVCPVQTPHVPTPSPKAKRLMPSLPPNVQRQKKQTLPPPPPRGGQKVSLSTTISKKPRLETGPFIFEDESG